MSKLHDEINDNIECAVHFNIFCQFVDCIFKNKIKRLLL